MQHVIELHPTPPFRLDLTAWVLRRRSRNRIDRWDDTYHRALIVGDRAVTVEVEQRGGPHEPHLTVTVPTGVRLSADERSSVQSQLIRMLGTDIDLGGFYDRADRDPRIGPLSRRLLGVKPPRFPTLFEALVNAIANQQISLEVGIELLNRFTDRFGVRPDDDRGFVAFPEPAAVLSGSIGELRAMGFSTRKAEYILASADAIVTGTIDEAALASLDRAGATEKLVGLRGIGRWSAEYVLLRGLGNLAVYPADDVGARNKLESFFSLATAPGREQILALMEPWHPYAGMIYFHLLLDGLAARGELDV